ncbi:MAG: Defensin propeptide [Roseibaca calidilacus]|uniref:Defensin propeptide n=1 Tax=Roseibaca calidilacus TaxID=1666912 RepID=A0A0P7YRM5_9RHOB|nr:hypothetical protein [Roseibaca calidilacus]KPP92981.1 MAG: Defensin propeptide [Roseibaca calidilacus]CUX80350.1 hypothetical protein Ga0058931_1059 [Roseibaca calidilacus]
MIRILLALLVLALPAQAQTPMTAAEFEAYVTGRTLTFGFDGQSYGVEEFREGRRTTWAFMQEECLEGSWFPRGEQICFVYDNYPSEEHCWIFWKGEDGLNARSMGDGDTELYEVQQSPRPLICPGPEVGV